MGTHEPVRSSLSVLVIVKGEFSTTRARVENMIGAIRPWHGVLGATALIAVVTSARSMSAESGTPTLIDEIVMVDVATGDILSFPLDGPTHSVSIPAVNPETKRRNLVPVHRDDRGDWILSSRYRNALDQTEDKARIVFDAQTGILSASMGRARRAR
jgi:hypothetical protein